MTKKNSTTNKLLSLSLSLSDFLLLQHYNLMEIDVSLKKNKTNVAPTFHSDLSDHSQKYITSLCIKQMP